MAVTRSQTTAAAGTADQITFQGNKRLKIALRSPFLPPNVGCDAEKPQPYDGLLMPEPSSEAERPVEEREEDYEYFHWLILRRKRNKDWQSAPVFDDDDEEEEEEESE